MNQDFAATLLGVLQDSSVTVTVFNDDMAILGMEGPVIISKAQAMKFFNLVEAPQVMANGLTEAETDASASVRGLGCGEAGHADGRCGNSQCLFDEPR